MAGIGVRLNRIFEKNTLTTNLVGFFYSTVVTVAPMFVIIINLILMEYLLDFASVGYVTRELFSCTILYTFIFSLLTASPFNAVLSRYMSDVIYEERYQDILPCYHIGMLLNIGLSCLLGIPFCLWEHFVGKVPTAYVFCGFCGYISLVLVFYSMIYLSICKDYQRISQYFFFGMLVAFVLALILHFILKWETTWSMLFSLTIGFFVTATLENALIRRYFVRNSNHYRPVLQYFRKYWKLIFTNFLYILGLYIHNFVFWTTDMRMEIAKSFVCNQPYDMASCLAMFTNISATIIFIARVEMNFHEKYKLYSEAVIGGKGACPVAVRKPAQWRELTLGWTEQEKKKLTLFNDGIFGSETDLGTYGTLSPETPGQKICSREEELEWQKNEMCGKFCGGEAIWGSGAEPAPFVSAPKAMADLERMHISYLNSTYDLRRLEQWKAETVEDESGLEAIGKRLGYRFVVEGVEFVSEREELQITLENKGFAELTEEADCYLELERNGTLQKKIQIATDARLWKSGEKTTLCQKIKLPAELAEPEEQKLYLALYRRRDGRTISFANQGEKQGRPFLGIFKIDPIVLI